MSYSVERFGVLKRMLAGWNAIGLESQHKFSI
jgi:hypothetical protein